MIETAAWIELVQFVAASLRKAGMCLFEVNRSRLFNGGDHDWGEALSGLGQLAANT